MARKKIPDSVLQRVLLNSKRRCCVCFNVGDAGTKEGAIARLDATLDPNDSNLAFLCMNHHADFDRGRISADAIIACRDSMYHCEPPVIETANESDPISAYEKHVVMLIEEKFRGAFNADFTIVRGAALLGESGCPRQVDLLIDVDIVGVTVRIIVDAKYRHSKVRLIGVTDVDVFAATVRDIGASKGIMVTNNGFSPAAEQVARRCNISLVIIKEGSQKIETVSNVLFTKIMTGRQGDTGVD